MKRHAQLLAALLISTLLTPCAAVSKKVEIRPVWQSGNAYIRLFKESGKSRGFDQPLQVQEEEVRRLLASLFFTRYEYFHWMEASRVFTDEEIQELARFFQQAFLEAGPDDQVEFYLPGLSRKLFGISETVMVCRGLAFAKAGAVHFRFDSVREKVQPTTYRPEDQDPVTQVAWKVLPQSGQQYDNETDILGNESPNPHWIRVDLSVLAGQPAVAPATVPAAPAAVPAPPSVVSPGPATIPAAPAAGRTPAPAAAVSAPPQAPQPAPVVTAPAAAPAATPAPVQTSLEKLKELKQMLDEGLITQKDYEKKKKEILDSL